MLSILVWGLVGCASFSKEATSDFDFVYGPDYRVQLDRQGVEKPQRLLILPLRGVLPSEEAVDFLRNFQSSLTTPVVLIQDPEVTNSGPGRGLDVKEVRAKAEYLGCEGILFLDVKENRPYQPFRVIVETVVENARGETLMRLVGHYDAQDRLVANSARRFYEQGVQKTADPSRSMVILQRKQLFLRFVADHMARSLWENLIPVTKS
jgi:hypothetical protein